MGTYDDILKAYLADLEEARRFALGWWDAMLARATPPSGEAEAAERAVRLRWPAGPVSHPRVIEVFRHYFLAVERLNEQMEARPGQQPASAGWGETDGEEEGIIPPRALLLDNLEVVAPKLARFMERFVFLCIGADPNGRTA